MTDTPANLPTVLVVAVALIDVDGRVPVSYTHLRAHET